MINHGSTGTGDNPASFVQTWINPDIADFLNERGWIVAFPQRRGRGKSDGRMTKGSPRDRVKGYTCDPEISLAGAYRALQDIEAAISVIRRRTDVASSPILIGGQSRGGVLSVAYAGGHPEQISASSISLVAGSVRAAPLPRLSMKRFSSGADALVSRRYGSMDGATRSIRSDIAARTLRLSKRLADGERSWNLRFQRATAIRCIVTHNCGLRRLMRTSTRSLLG